MTDDLTARRRTAAAHGLAEFERWARGETIPGDWRTWATRLAAELAGLLEALPADAEPADPARPGTVASDTYGEITAAELAELRAAASPCLVCGMLADVDPELHRERYGHRPEYRDADGAVRVWFAGRWAEKLDAEPDPDPYDDDRNPACPRCGAVSWGQTPDGRPECTRCLYAEGVAE